MGNTSYDFEARATRSLDRGYATKRKEEIFKSRKMPADMDPRQIRVREARDSEEHPESFPVIVGLDQTGSMGRIPQHLIANGLPRVIGLCHGADLPDVAILFCAIGDHSFHEEAPLQVGQFESGDKELDHWLESVYLEGKGGGNRGESYLFAWVVAGWFAQTDAWDKRKKKGIVVTVGDEPCLPEISADKLRHYLGEDIAKDYPELSEGVTAEAALMKAKEKFEVHHIHCSDGSYGQLPVQGWEELIGSMYVHPATEDGVAGIIGMLAATQAHSDPASNPEEVPITEDIPEQDAVTDTRPIL